jgi:hypothetical protein
MTCFASLCSFGLAAFFVFLTRIEDD